MIDENQAYYFSLKVLFLIELLKWECWKLIIINLLFVLCESDDENILCYYIINEMLQ